MRTNIDLDDQLINKALKYSRLSTKKDVVNSALKDFVEKHAKLEMLKMRGSVAWEGDLEEMRTAGYE
jgi:Arc/MetJ family transcription regulator